MYQCRPRHRFEGEGDGVVGRVRYVDGRIWINASQYFTDVPPEVWAYEIGSYRVCEKWLRDRKGEVLRYEDVRQYRAILVSVAETLGVMGEIDGVLWEEGRSHLVGYKCYHSCTCVSCSIIWALNLSSFAFSAKSNAL